LLSLNKIVAIFFAESYEMFHFEKRIGGDNTHIEKYPIVVFTEFDICPFEDAKNLLLFFLD
jgi:hypothetical protein